MGSHDLQYGFFTDSTLCIGCKACEVACKQWNRLEADGLEFTGFSYDNTVRLGAQSWRHVAFVEQPLPLTDGGPAQRWLMLSDVCKHCTSAGCLNVCPTGAIVRTEFDTVYVQPDICNGCGYCVAACPFGVVQVDLGGMGTARKCTLCYDRLSGGLEPACAKVCPTDSILFGDLATLQAKAQERVTMLRQSGVPAARLWGVEEATAGGLNAFFLIVDRPEVYGLPVRATDPTVRAAPSARHGFVAALAYLLFTALIFRRA